MCPEIQTIHFKTCTYISVLAMVSNIFIQYSFNLVVFLVEEVSVNEASTASTLSPIEGEDAKIIIPIREVLEGLDSGSEVRMAALLFRNMSGLLPEKIDYEDR